jgi:hypothetical protein
MCDACLSFPSMNSFCFRSLDDRHILTVAAGMYVLSMCTYYLCVRTIYVYVLSVCTTSLYVRTL